MVGLVCRRLPELKVYNLHFSLMCSISSSEVSTPFERGARATGLKSSGALVKQPLLKCASLARGSVQGRQLFDGYHHTTSKKEQLGSLLEVI